MNRQGKVTKTQGATGPRCPAELGMADHRRASEVTSRPCKTIIKAKA